MSNMEKTKVLFLDTETTGLPPKNSNWRTDWNLFPYLVSIAWEMDGAEKYRLINPDGYVISEEVSKIHGITQEMAVEHGVPFVDVLTDLITDLRNSIAVVGHNLYFDSSILKANCIRYLGVDYYNRYLDELLDVSRRVDTMKKTIKFVGAKYENGRVSKFPRLEELYEKLFPGDTFAAHNALADALATKRCFWALVDLGIIDRPVGVQSTLDFQEPEIKIEVDGEVDFAAALNEFGETASNYLKNGGSVADVLASDDLKKGLAEPFTAEVEEKKGGILKNYKR